METKLKDPKIGLIPLYLALYDENLPEYRPSMEAFARQVAERLRVVDLEVFLGGICRTREEIGRVVQGFTDTGVDLLVTLHLAYSPSLEAIEPLMSVDTPLLLLDTTPAARFADNVNEAEVMQNHGIHGVQDLASLLRRRGRKYQVVAGHLNDIDVLHQVAAAARAAQATRAFTSMRVMAVGRSFSGMGDFQVEPEVLREAFGVEVVPVTAEQLAVAAGSVSAGDIIGENALDMEIYNCAGLEPEALTDSNRIGLGIRALLRETHAGAFTANFDDFDLSLGLRTYPFLEASKAMARGVGYAGEGDTLTAALVGGLLHALGAVTFCEMFCPDWAEHWLLMTHMGECNLALAADTPVLVEKPFAFGQLQNPVVPIFTLAAGSATLVNLAPGADGSFGLIAAPVRILARAVERGIPYSPHFWIRPGGENLPDFLERFSEYGGTHHSALLYGDQMPVMQHMARMLGIAFHPLGLAPV
jgi:L-arabinose isomerase